MPELTLEQFNQEQWLAARVGMKLFDLGITTPDLRREALRAFILENNPDRVIGKSRNKELLTARAAFELCFGQPLQTDELRLSMTLTEGT